MDRKIKKKVWTAKRIFTILGITGVVALIAYVFFFADKSSKLNVELDKINVAAVTEGAFQEFIPVEGTVNPKTTIYVGALVGGNVEEKFLDGGVEVEKGDTILKLENNNLQMQYVQEQTQTNRLRNDIENTNLSLQQRLFQSKSAIINLDFDIDQAKDAYTRNKQLWEDKVISEQEYLNSKRMYDRLMARRVNEIESAKFDSITAVNTIAQNQERLGTSNVSLKMVENNLNNLWVTARITGLLSTVNPEVGQTVSPGQNIAQIDDLDGFKIVARVDQHYLDRVYLGLRGNFDFGGSNYGLVIRKIFPEINSGQFNVEMMFEGEAPENIRRGQTVPIKLQLSEERQAIMIPRGAFFQTTGGNWIFVVDASGEFAERRKISIGNQNTRQYEVLEGLKPGEQVITSSYDGYEDKDKLIIKK
ncbi:efflux RND transporter periplasmic adaptor subunit [Roseivirga sp.]|uniref:efflux RND transporter periplasmic adaptor subunit n=1 Tax=Roseivirga sp. TaxID=1964215 RepID=UPI002B272E5C|nr:efflux RND transporter periplasmic adaptor subunit [Roseivirga sp.]